ncbi:MAG: hypothetical protein IJF13_05415 [Clostridia bacterium]|nr:hypothetical protein [Clostridia bacterium]
MHSEKIRPILSTSVGSVLQFAFYTGVSKLSFMIFTYNMFGQDYMPERVLDTVKLIISLFVFYSASYVFSVNSKYALRDYEDRGPSENYFGEKLGYTLRCRFFWIRFLPVAVLSAVLPLSVTYSFVGGVFFPHLSGAALKLSVLAVILPVLFLLTLAANIESLRRWFYLKHKKKAIGTGTLKTAKELCLVVAVFFAASLCIPWFLPFLVTVINFAARYNIISFILYAAAAILTVIFGYLFFVYLRALLKRKAFMSSLKRLCERDGIIFSSVRGVYSSVFIKKPGISFSLMKNGRCYDCKFLSGTFYGSPIIFSENGDALCKHTFRLLRFELFSVLSRIDYGFESENEKILIVLPVPKDIYVSDGDSQPRPADTGDKAGDYRIYNATGFLGGLERDSIA